MLVDARTHHVTHIVMPMRRFIAARRNVVPIEVEYRALDPQSAQTRFFLGLAQRHPRQVTIAIGVTTQLQPTIQFAVMRQKRPFAVAADQPGRTGEMPEGMTAFEYIRVRMQKTQKIVDRVRLHRPLVTIMSKSAIQRGLKRMHDGHCA